jgi:RNA polymerase sigma-70 factor, ECF subfamily
MSYGRLMEPKPILLKESGRAFVLPSEMKASHVTPAAIEALYRARFRAFLLSVTALVGDGEAAFDVVQEGFGLALARRQTFRNEGSLEAWVWRIVLNVARDELRSRQRQHFRPIEQPYARNEHDEELRVVLRALPERQRLAIFLRYYADMSYAEIAEVLGIAAGTVAASLNAAHRAVRRDLREEVRE